MDLVKLRSHNIFLSLLSHRAAAASSPPTPTLPFSLSPLVPPPPTVVLLDQRPRTKDTGMHLLSHTPFSTQHEEVEEGEREAGCEKKGGGHSGGRKKKGQRGCFCDCRDNGLCAAAMSGYKGHQCHADKRPEAPPCSRSHAGTDATRALPSGEEDGVWDVARQGVEAEGRNQKVSTRSCSVVHKIKPPRKQTMTCVCAVTCFYVRKTCTMDTGRLRLVGWCQCIKYRWHKCARLAHCVCMCVLLQLCQENNSG